MNSITKFCEDPTITNWNKISQINKNTMIGIAVYCLNNNIGNKNIAKIIASYKKSHLQKPMDLSLVYRTTQSRVNLSNLIKQHLSSIVKVFGEVCVNGKNTKLLEKIELKKLLGFGCFGNVYSACLPKPCNDNSYNFAIKLAKLKKNEFRWNRIVEFRQSFHEYFFLNDLIKPLVVNGICPNLPLLIDTFTCNDCEIITPQFDRNKYTHDKISSGNDCLLFLTELATLGDMRHWVNSKPKPNEDQLYSALFQIMAGIHTIQTKLQLVNSDIKSDNIIVYDVKPGGYWEYVVYGKKYYVPNYGQLFILNDFGTSGTYSPDYNLTETKKEKEIGLGQRNKIIINGKYSIANSKSGALYPGSIIAYDKKNPDMFDVIEHYKWALIFLDIKTQEIDDGGLELTQQQKDYLRQKNITTNTKSKQFYNHPDIIPPGSFILDTQDCIRMFLGWPKASQRNQLHPRIDITKKMRNQLSVYGMYGILPRYHRSTRPQNEIAGYFIQEFFSIHKDYTQKPKNGKIIQTFNIS